MRWRKGSAYSLERQHGVAVHHDAEVVDLFMFVERRGMRLLHRMAQRLKQLGDVLDGGHTVGVQRSPALWRPLHQADPKPAPGWRRSPG